MAIIGNIPYFQTNPYEYLDYIPIINNDENLWLFWFISPYEFWYESKYLDYTGLCRLTMVNNDENLWLSGWWLVLTFWNVWVRQWEGWHPIYEMENKKCSKPPTRHIDLLVLNVGIDGLLGVAGKWLWIIPSFPTFSTSKHGMGLSAILSILKI